VGSGESIQAAIDVASPGDTILVSPGIYNESLLVNKTISLIGTGIDATIINGQNDEYVISIVAPASDVIIEGFTVQSALVPTYGIEINSPFGGDTISGNKVQGCQQGISFSFSTSNVITDNTITGNTVVGLVVYDSSGIVFHRNVVESNYQGSYIIDSSSNVFTGNTFQGNLNPNGAESIADSQNNTFTDNNFLDSVIDSYGGNSWNNTIEGNFWFDYNGSNGGNGTGIQPYSGSPVAGSTNHIIDYHPLLGQYLSCEATLGSSTYEVYVISNSTVSNLQFQIGEETGNKIIRFNVEGSEGTYGFARLVIPVGLMGTPLTVLVSGQQINPNTTSEYMYFTYAHSNQTILVISSLALDSYYQLLQQFNELNSTYYQLAANYTAEFEVIKNDTTQFNTLASYAALLNSTYSQISSAYANLLGNYSQLQQKYQDLNSSYQQHLTDYNQNLQNVRNLMYIFAAATAVLIIATVYFSRRTYPRHIEGRSTSELASSSRALGLLST
jgi:parallel beta-helix repeat protein